METLIKSILSGDNAFFVTDEHYYRLGGDYSPIIIDLDNPPPPLSPPTPVLADMKQPSWPQPNDSDSYRRTALMLFRSAMDGAIPAHVPMGEIHRAIECRLSEILYFCGLFPEDRSVIPRRYLSFTKKVRFGEKIIPESIIPRSLFTRMGKTRNMAEHQYQEPERNDLKESLETMNLFFEATQRYFDILYYYSMFKYPSDTQAQHIVVQILRDKGALLVFGDGDNPTTLQGLRSDGELALTLLKKIMADIEFYLDHDTGFMKKLGF